MTVVNPRAAARLGWFCVGLSLVCFTVVLTILMKRDEPALTGALIATLAPIIPGIVMIAKSRQALR